MSTLNRKYDRDRRGHGARRRGPSGRRRQPKRWGLISALVAMPVIALGGGGYAAYRYLQIEQMDAQFCYARADQEQLVFYLDYSVNLTPAQRRDIRRAALQCFEAMERNGRFMTSNRNSAGSIAELCRSAASAAEQATIDAPEKTPQNLAYDPAEARKAFEAHVETILAELMDETQTARESAILIDLRAISRYPGFQGERRSLIWLSDGLESCSTSRSGQTQGVFPPAPTFAARSITI